MEQQSLLDSIILHLSESSLSGESFITDVLERLDSFGYVVKDSDAWMISFSVQKVENTIKNECNVLAVPKGLHNVAVDMVCGEFLFALKQVGKLEDFELDQAVLKVSLGDTSVDFDSSNTPEERLNLLLNYLQNNGRGELISYRRIKW